MTQALTRSLSLTQLIFYGVGTIVGAGIYTIIGSAAGLAGTALWVSMLCAGAAAFLTALSYAELVSMLPKAGAEYQFLKAAFPKAPLVSFLAGFLIALNAAATSATVSLAFAGYLKVFLDLPAPLTALALLSVCTALNIVGLRQSTWVSIGMIVIEVGGLLLLIVMGLFKGDAGAAITLPSFGDAPGVFAATALVFFVYIGFEDVANLSEEAKTPRRDVPRALLWSVAITSLLYLLVVWAVFAVMDPGQLAQSDSPLTAAGRAVAPWLGQTLAITAMFATASTALISLVSISRLLFGMARDGDMPRALAKTMSRRKTPWVAALALYAGACVLLPLGEVRIIASVSALAILGVFVGVHTAVIALRFKSPGRERPFRTPVHVGRLPLLPPVGIAISLALMTQFEPVVYAVTGAAVMFGMVVFWISRRVR
ncbi:MAG: amino acid permease [Chitinophagaceae bacterium]|nr:amino acid permease [Rubrivivax sp.]